MEVKTYELMFGKQLTVRDLVSGFTEDTKTGSVTSMDGKLNIRPPYQREFVYEMDKQREVINTILAGYPLNAIYFAASDDGTFELMDGQQRILSICKFYQGGSHVYREIGGKKDEVTINYLGPDKDKFLDYTLNVYVCEGDEEEKLAWFRIINIAGVKLTQQEMRNAIYNGPWVTAAKKYFSRADGEGFLSEGDPATDNGHIYGDYVDVVGGKKSEKENSVVRQKLFEIVLKWAVDKYNRDNGLEKEDAMTIDRYMKLHRNDPNAKELSRYYEDVIEWVRGTFPVYRSFMKKVDWGILYNEYGPDPVIGAEAKVIKIMESADQISNIKEVYHAVLSGDLKYLNARNFDKNDMAWKYEQQAGICPYCREHFNEDQMHGDHIIPWTKGGKTERSNLQMLCVACNSKKSNYDVKYAPWDNSIYKEFDLEEWDNTVPED